ncbi:MAG: hypothetical protein COB37_00820 [Kordiimonadales bacterium]|nr:MAG: hypothetical protein COB37_00820 [Kordiimonadales bacterium]
MFRLFRHLPIVILTATLAATATEASRDFPTKWAHEKSDLKVDDRIRYGTLKNGMRYAVMPNATPENQAYIRFSFDVGSALERPNEQGMAHFLEHMAFNGSKNVPEGEMVKILERRGLAFGADTNASTSYSQTIYQLDLPNLDTETIDASFFLMRETASNLTIDADALDRERGVILAEKRNRNAEAYRNYQEQTSFLYPGTRVLERSPIGTDKTLKTMSAEEMRQFYNDFYRPDRAIFIIVGDVDADETIAKIEQVFGDWQAAGMPRDTSYADDKSDYATTAPQAKHWSSENSTATLNISLLTPYTEQKDSLETRKGQYLTAVTNTIFNRRLQDLQQEGKAAFLNGGLGNSSFNELADLAQFGLIVEEGKWEDGLRDGMTELKRAISYGFTQAELDETLTNFRAGAENAVKSAAKRRSAGLAGLILSRFLGENVVTTAETNLEIFNAVAETITTEALHAEFRETWTAAAPKMFFLTKGDIENAEERLLTAYSDNLRIAVAAPKEKVTASFAYTDFGTPGKVVSRTDIEDTQSLAVRFENNVMLNIKKTKWQDNIALMQLRFGGGLASIPKSNPGLRTLLGTAFSGGGIEAHTVVELQRILAGKTVSANLGSSNGSFQFTAGGTPEDQLLQLQLWAAYMTAPAYRDEPVQQFRRQVEAVYANLEATAGQVARTKVPNLLHGGDPRFGLPAKDAIQSVGAEDVKNFLADQLAKAAIEISVVGDIDVEATIAAVAQTFGALPTRQTAPLPYEEGRIVSFPSAGVTTLHHKGSVDQAILQMYWPTVDYSDVERSARLDVLTALFTDRLREAIREKLGASYSPAVFNTEDSTFPLFGFIGVTLDAKPSDLDTLSTAIQIEIDKIVADGFTEDELERGRRPMIEGMENAKKTNGHWLGRINRTQTKPASLTEYFEIYDTYTTVTTAELQALAKLYLKPETAFKVQIVPRVAAAAATASE